MTDSSVDDLPTDPWRALPGSAIAVLFLHGLQRFVRENLFLFFGAGTGFALADSLGLRELWLVLAFIVLAGLLVALIYHRRFRYRVDADAMRVRKGLFEQTEVKVRFERVQNVAFSQPFYMRPLGLTRLVLDTPGSAQSEVSLPGVRISDAVGIRDRVAAFRDPETIAETIAETTGRSSGETIVAGHGDDRTEDAAAESANESANVLYAPGVTDLFKYGLTSNQVWLYLAVFAGPISQQVERRLSGWLERLAQTAPEQFEALSQAPLAIALLVGVGIIGFAAMIMLLSGLLAVLRFHGYRLDSVDHRFIARFGLLETREKSLRHSRLHSIALVQTAVGRLLDHWHAIGHQTGVAAQGPGGEDRRFLIPAIDSRKLPEVMSLLVGPDWRIPEWQPVSSRFRTILSLRLGLMFGGLVMIPGQAVFDIGWLSNLVLALAVVVVTTLLVHWRWRRWGWYSDGTRMRIRSGLIGQNIIGFEMERCQQVRVQSSPYQRRHGLVSLKFRLPHGDVELPYLPRETADALVNRTLHRVETALLHAL